jgi:hypothetical protein
MSIPPYPLSWPEALPRTEHKATSRFNSSLSAALKNVRKSLELFAVDSGKAVTDIVLSSNVGGLDPGQPAIPASPHGSHGTASSAASPSTAIRR